MAQLSEDARICQDRHGNRVDFHEACHTCWKRRAEKAEARTIEVANVAGQYRTALTRIANIESESESWEDAVWTCISVAEKALQTIRE